MLIRAPAFVAVRGIEDEASLRLKMSPKMRSKLNKSVFFLPEHITSATRHVSSTKVRESVRLGESTELVSPPIFEYVLKHKLYQP
jgi:nicotinic acid mononucleotide adenylyltransferase